MQGCEVALKVVGTSLLEPSAYCQGVFTPGAVDIYENDLFPVPQCPINVEGHLLVTLAGAEDLQGGVTSPSPQWSKTPNAQA